MWPSNDDTDNACFQKLSKLSSKIFLARDYENESKPC